MHIHIYIPNRNAQEICIRMYIGARHWWLMPVILVTQEAQRSGGSSFEASLSK
jgi:hypothetical protein